MVKPKAANKYIPIAGLQAMTADIKPIAQTEADRAGVLLFRVMSPKCKSGAESVAFRSVVHWAVTNMWTQGLGENMRYQCKPDRPTECGSRPAKWRKLSHPLMSIVMGGQDQSCFGQILKPDDSKKTLDIPQPVA